MLRRFWSWYKNGWRRATRDTDALEQNGDYGFSCAWAALHGQLLVLLVVLLRVVERAIVFWLLRPRP